MSVIRGVPSVLELVKDTSERPGDADSEARVCVVVDQAIHGEALWFDAAEHGMWHLLGFAGDVFVALFEPPNRDKVYPPTSWTIEREGPFAVHQVLEAAYVCPTKDDEYCVAWHPGQDEEPPPDPEVLDTTPKEFYCPDAQALPCKPQGYNSEVHVLDPVTGRTFVFGPFKRQPFPKVVADPASRTIRIRTTSCETTHATW